MLSNLITNAMDACSPGGRIIVKAREASTSDGDHEVEISVIDNGAGIRPEDMERIFEPFFTTKAPGSGLGLGLDTVNRIIRVHRGYVNVRSEAGQTCFEIGLPLEQLQAY